MRHARLVLFFVCLLSGALLSEAFNVTHFVPRKIRTIEESLKRASIVLEVEFCIVIKADLPFEVVHMVKSSIEGQYAKVASATGLSAAAVYNCTTFDAVQSRLGTLLVVECQFDPSLLDNQQLQFVQDLTSLSMTMTYATSFALPPKYTVEKNHVMKVIKPDNVIPVNVSGMTTSQKRTSDVQVETNVPLNLDRLDQRTTAYDGMYAFRATGMNVSIYLVDTGVETTHPEFNQKGRQRAFLIANTIDDINSDCNGHGTHVSGLAGGYFFGVGKDVTLNMCKGLDCAGGGTVGTVVSCIFAIDADASVTNVNKLFVVSMSLSGPPSSTLATALQDLMTAHYVKIFVAAGNSNADACGFSPSGVSGVFAVGASDMNDLRASFSNFGSCVKLYAPGVSSTSAWIGGLYAQLSGTSQACPPVAGAAACIIEQMERNYTSTQSNAISAVETIILDQASRPSTLDKGLLFTFFDASIDNNFGLPIPPPTGTPATPAPKVPTALPPSPVGPTPPPFAAPILHPEGGAGGNPNSVEEETSSAFFWDFASSNLGIVWIMSIAWVITTHAT